MNWEQLKGIVERVVTFGVAYTVGKGWVPQAVSADLVGGIVMIASVAWGWYVNTHTALITATKNVAS